MYPDLKRKDYGYAGPSWASVSFQISDDLFWKSLPRSRPEVHFGKVLRGLIPQGADPPGG